MKLFLFMFLAIIIFFIPLPIKISIYISSENYYLKLYRFFILKKNNNITASDPDMKKPYKCKRKKKPSLLKEISRKKLVKLFKLLNNNKFKPLLRINGYCSYSLGDAARTAIFYGVLYTYFPLLLFVLNIFFRTKELSLPIKPIYEDKFMAKTEITSIITLSLAQIIYISVLLIKSINILKEVRLERANI